MARWKLATAHYLNVVGTKWEYTEVSRTTGKQIRVQLPVPTLLDPRDPADYTHKWGRGEEGEGEIIVCQGLTDDPKDVVFVGDPTPDMIPLDDEARAISAGFAERWRYKPDIESPGNYSQSLVDQFQMSMAEATSKPARIEGLDELVAGMSEMVKSNQALVQLVAGSVRRI